MNKNTVHSIAGYCSEKALWKLLVDLIRDALKPLGEDYINCYNKIIDNHYIDYCEYKGKCSGGYSASTIDHDSRILLSFNDDLDLSCNELFANGKIIKTVFDNLIAMQNDTNNKNNLIYIFYGVEKLKNEVDTQKLDALFDSIKKSTNGKAILFEAAKSLKGMELESWYTKIKNNTDGIWIGKGFSEQQVFRIAKLTKDMSENYTNSYGFAIVESEVSLMKVIEFNDINKGEDGDEE